MTTERIEHPGTTLSSRVQELVSTLKASGRRVTPQRLAIISAFGDSRYHPSVESVYEALKPTLPTISLATVYKTISLLKSLNQAVEIGFGDDHNRYDVRRPRPHPHLICQKCRSIVDLDYDPMTPVAQALGDRTGYEILCQRVDVYGICPNCQKEAS
ncbi:MAG: transcriptional repressor [Desulfobacterales bacterium]